MIDLLKREPVRIFVALDILTGYAINGLVIWQAWQPTEEQLAWVNGLWTTIGAALGITLVRQAVTPNPTVNLLTAAAWEDGADGRESPDPV